MTKYFYHYTGGCCGTDVYGVLEGFSADDVREALHCEVIEHMEEWPGEDDWYELEADADVVEYVPELHDDYL